MVVVSKFHNDKSHGRYGDAAEGRCVRECDRCGRCAWLCKGRSYVMVALILREKLNGCDGEWGGRRYLGHSNRRTRREAGG